MTVPGARLQFLHPDEEERDPSRPLHRGQVPQRARDDASHGAATRLQPPRSRSVKKRLMS